MNKTELIAEVAKKCGISKKDAEKAVTTTFDTIADALSQGDKVQLVGFGGFETKKREARMGRNPKTKEAIEIPATTIPVFKAGKALKEKTAKSVRSPQGSRTAALFFAHRSHSVNFFGSQIIIYKLFPDLRLTFLSFAAIILWSASADDPCRRRDLRP